MRTLKSLWVMLVVFALNSTFTQAQAPGCPNLTASAAANSNDTITCNVSCANLTSSVVLPGNTSSYSVSSIPFSLPFPTGSGTGVSVNTDDIYSPLINLPFTFCFFGNQYTNIVVGSNGVITFDATLANGYCPWSFSATVPSGSLPPNAIFGVYHDIDPSVCGNVRYNFFGNAPCRTFVVSFDNVCHYSCNTIQSTTQVVLYETTNIIEVYVQNKPTCSGWNSGNAVIGIQDNAGATGYTPPGRNTGSWTASNEAWRFTPAGPSNYSITWHELPSMNQVDTGANATVCPINTTDYVAQATYVKCDGNNLIVSDTIKVVVDDSSKVSILENDTAICNGSSITLHTVVADSGGSYSWSPGGQTSDTLVVSPSTTTKYYVTYTNGTCSSTDSIEVSVFSSPPVSVNDTSICNGDTVTLQASSPVAGGSYSWLPGGQTSDSITVNPSSTSNYIVTYSHPSCSSSSSDTGTVTVSPAPVAAINGDSLICPNDTTTLYASGGSSYTWSTGATADSIVVAPAADSTYGVLVSVGSCTDTASITVSISTPPTINVSGNDSICEGDSASFVASGAATYSWNPTGQSGDTAIFAPSTTTNYTVTGVDSVGCSDTSAFTIYVGQAPNVNISGDTTICSGDTTLLTGSGASSYQWSTGSTSTSINYTSDSTDQVVLTGYSAINNCPAYDTATIYVYELPDVQIAGDNQICEGDIITLSGSGADTYTWLPSNISTDSVTIAPVADTALFLTGVDTNGCEDMDTIFVAVHNNPDVDFSFSPDEGCSELCVDFADNSSVAGGSIVSWNWDFQVGENSDKQDPTRCFYNTSETSKDLYPTLTVTTNNGCTGSFTTSDPVTVFPQPEASFNILTEEPFLKGKPIDFESTSTYADSWLWEAGKMSSNEENPTFTFNEKGEVKICHTASNQYACEDSTCTMIEIITEIRIPNIITPNDDNRNDEFFVEGLYGSGNALTIFDRWGIKVFESEDYQNDWEGTTKNGKRVSDGTYMFILKDNQGNVHKGTFTVLH